MDRRQLFATPLAVFDLPETDATNDALRERLLEEEGGTSGLQRSNYGGWHSPTDLALREEPYFRNIVRRIRERTGELVATLLPEGAAAPPLKLVHAWAMVMRAGDYTVIHDHGEADWSCAYYVDDGDGGASGAIAFSDPRVGIRRDGPVDLYPALVALAPRSGRLVVFPGWLQHQVFTYQGARPRISISANLVLAG